jgi:hypothetical protein
MAPILIYYACYVFFMPFEYKIEYLKTLFLVGSIVSFGLAAMIVIVISLGIIKTLNTMNSRVGIVTYLEAFCFFIA